MIVFVIIFLSLLILGIFVFCYRNNIRSFNDLKAHFAKKDQANTNQENNKDNKVEDKPKDNKMEDKPKINPITQQVAFNPNTSNVSTPPATNNSNTSNVSTPPTINNNNSPKVSTPPANSNNNTPNVSTPPTISNSNNASITTGTQNTFLIPENPLDPLIFVDIKTTFEGAQENCKSKNMRLATRNELLKARNKGYQSTDNVYLNDGLIHYAVQPGTFVLGCDTSDGICTQKAVYIHPFMCAPI